MMKETIIEAVLKAYERTKPHLVDGLPDHLPVQVLVVFRLGDLRELERGGYKTTILSGG